MFRSLRSMIRSLTRRRVRPEKPAARLMAYRKFGLQLEHLEARDVPTVLGAGDVQFVGYNVSGAPDHFSIVVMRDLVAGDLFFVNDNEVATAGGSTFTDLNEAEATFSVTGAIPAGSVFALPWGNTGGGTLTGSNFTFTFPTNAGLGATSGVGDDGLYLYTASSVTSTTATAFLGYLKLGTNATTSGQVPAGLTLGTDAIQLTTGAANRYKTTGAVYSGTQTALNTAINTVANWENVVPGYPTADTYNFSITSGNAPPTITTASPLPTAYESQAYTTTIAASGTPAPTFSVTAGSLPPGLTLSAAGVLSGTPTSTGTFNFSVTADNTVGGAGTGTDTDAFTLSVIAGTTTSLTAPTPNPAAYAQAVTFAGSVTASSGGPVNAGTVEIRASAGGTALGSGAVDAGGNYSFTISTLNPGSYATLAAYYTGTGTFGPSASPVIAAPLVVQPFTTSGTALAAGDIAFTGYYGDTTAGDGERFSFVLLQDVAAGTSVIFTDAGFDGTAGVNALIAEGTYAVVFDTARTAGSRFYYETAPAATTGFKNFDGTQTGLTTVVYGNTGFANGGDNLFAVQGSVASPTFLAGFSTATPITTGTPTSGNTYVPAALVSGQTFVALGGDFNGNLDPTDPDVGPTVSGTVGAIGAVVNTFENWVTTTGSTAPVVPPAVAFVVTTGGTATTTTLNAPAPGTVTQGFPVTFSGSVAAASGTAAPAGTIQIREGGPTGTLLATGTLTAAGSGTTSTYSFSTAFVPAGTFTNVTAYFVAGSGFTDSNSGGGQSLTVNAATPTTFAAGDVAFTGYSGLTSVERFSFVVLTDVSATTVLNFTDNAFDGTAFLATEGLYQVTFNQFFPAGSRFYYQSNPQAFRNWDGTATGLTTAVTGNTGFNNSGDNLTAFQGTLAAPTGFAAAFATRPFLTSGTVTGNDTYLPTGLTTGTSAITLNQAGSTGIDGALNTPPNTLSASTVGGVGSTVNSLANWFTTPQAFATPPLAAFVVTAGTGTSTDLTTTAAAPNTTFDLIAGVSPNPGAGVSVTFRYLLDDGGTRSFVTLGSALTDASGVATFTQAGGLPGGNYTFTSDFAGTGLAAGQFGPSLGVLSLSLGTATTTTVSGATAPGTRVAVGGTTTYTATVSGAPSVGTVQFFDNGVALGAPVAVTGGTATTPAVTLAQGAHFITATYSGGGAFSGSTSTVAYTQNVLNPFGAGNLTVVRLGTGTGTLTNGATYVFIDEITPAGALVQSLVMPGLDAGTQQQFFDSGTATSDGGLSLSVSGEYLTLTGYDAPAGTTGVVAAAGLDRVIARVDAFGNVDTTTTIDPTEFFAANNIRSAATDDGTRFWAAGSNGSAGGVAYTPFGASTGAVNVQPAGVFSARVVTIQGGNLYVSSTFQGNLHQIGTGLPVTTGQLAVALPGLSDTVFTNPNGYLLLDRDAGVAGVDTLYIADQNSATATPTGGIYKYSFDGTTWTSRGSVLGTSGLFTGITGSVVGGNVVLYATQGGTSATGASSFSKVVTLTDTAAFNATITGTPTDVFAMPADSNKVFRGIAVAPRADGATASTTTLTPASSTISEGQSVTLTATVTGATTPTGLVSLQVGGVTVASALVNAGGVATFVLTGLTAAAGPYSYTAVYNGDATYANSTSAAATVTVTAAVATTTTVTSSAPGTAAVGANVTLTATVAPATGALTTADGTVTLTLNGIPVNVAPTYSTSGNDLVATFVIPTALVQTITAGQTGTLTPGITSATAAFVPAGTSTAAASGGTFNQSVAPQAFGSGNLTVFRAGNGVQSNLVTTGSAVYVDEITPAGALVQTVAFPTVTVGDRHSLLAHGQQSTDNQLTRSGDGTALYVVGYSSPTGFLTTGDVRSGQDRTVGRITLTATPTVSSAVSVSGANQPAQNFNIRGVYSPDGDKVYLGGSGGLFYVSSYTSAAGAAVTAATAIDPAVNVYSIGQLGTDLLVTQNVNTPSIGTYTGLPTASALFTLLTGFPTVQTWTAGSPTGDPSRLVQPFLADLSPTVGFGGTAVDTIYVGSSQVFDASPLSKYTWTGSAWVLSGNIVGVAASTPGFNYLAGSQAGTSVTLFMTHDRGGGATSDPQSTVYTVTDTGGYNAAFSTTTPTVVRQNTAASNPQQYYRGIAQVPVAADTTPPALTSFVRQTPAAATTNADTLVFRATFSEPVVNVDAADFAVNSTTTATVTGVALVSPGVYDITVAGGNLAGFNGAVNLNLAAGQNITDVALNALPAGEPGTDQTYTLDNAAPTVAITDNVGGGPVTVGAVITYTLTFSEAVTGVEAGDISNVGSATGTFASFTAVSPTVYTIQFTTTGTGAATLRVSSAGAVIQDAATNPLATPVDDAPITVNAAGAVYSLSSATYATAEGQTFVTITVTRSVGTGAATVELVAAAGGGNPAASPADFAGGTYVVPFLNGQLSATQTIAIVDDATVDDDETFIVTIQNPSVGTVGGTATGTVTIDDPVLAVQAVTATPSGFVATFNRAFQTAMLNVYEPTTAGTALGAADVTLKLAGAMKFGSVVLDANQPNALTYVVTDQLTNATTTLAGVLTPGTTYDYALKGGAAAFQGRDGRVMTTATGTVTGPTPVNGSPYVVSVASFARMANEAVSVPATNTIAGIPVFLDRVTTAAAENVEAMEFNIVYDPAVLDITGATTPIAGFTATFNPNLLDGTFPAHLKKARLVLTTGGAGVSVGPNAHLAIAHLQATVVSTAAVGSKHVLDIQAAVISDTTGGSTSFLARDNDGLHVAAGFADVDGNKDLNATDGTRVSQVAARIEENTGADIFPGFAASAVGQTSLQLLDPSVIADIDLSGVDTVTNPQGLVQSTDATRVAQNAADPTNPTVRPEIPVLPAAPNAQPGGADPRLYVTTFAARPYSFQSGPNVPDGDNPVTGTVGAGGSVQYSVRMHVTEDAGILFDAGQFSFQFDHTKFQVTAVTSRVPGFTVTTNGSFNSNGLLNVVLTTGTLGQALIDGQDVAIADITLEALGSASGTSPLNLRANNGGFTTFINNGEFGVALLNPAPTNADNDARIDGAVQVAGATGRLFVPPTTNAAPGGTFNLPVSLQNGAVQVLFDAGQFNLQFDHTQLQITTVVTNVPGFSVTTNGNFNNDGLLNVVLTTGTLGQTLTPSQVLELVVITFSVNAGVSGSLPLDVQANNGGFTTFINNGEVGPITLSPAPTNANTDADVDGVVSVVAVLNQPPLVLVPASNTTPATNPVRVLAGRGLAFNGATAITVSDPNAADNLLVTLSVPVGTLTVGTPGAATVTTNGTGSVTVTGSQSEVTAALATLVFRSPATFSGNVLLTVNANDQSTNQGGPRADTKYVNVTVVRLFLNEIVFNPPGTDAPNEYVEIRSTVPNFEIPVGTYLVGIEANGTTAGNGTNAGSVNELFNLGVLSAANRTTGTNGLLVIRQSGSPYTGAGADGATVVTATGTGFQNGVGFSGNNAGQFDIENAGSSFLLLSVDPDGTAPTLATDLDAANNGTINGAGAATYATWAVNDSVAALLGGAALPNYGYAATTYRPSGSSGTGLSGSTLVTGTGTWIAGYAGRVGNSTGNSSADWVFASGNGSLPTGTGLAGAANAFTFGAEVFTGAAGTFTGKGVAPQIGRANYFVTALTSVDVNFAGSAQRSQVVQLVVNFNAPVTTVDPSKVVLTGWVGVVGTTVTLAGDGLSATIAFTGGADTFALANPFAGNAVALLDGRYQLLIQDGAFSDAGGVIDIDNNGSAGGTRAFDFFRFFGDTDGDGDVDATDRGVFNAMYDNNNENGEGEPDGVINAFDDTYFWFLDYSNDNTIDRDPASAAAGNPVKDYANFLLNARRRTLAAGAPGAGVPSAYLARGPRI